MLNWKGAKLATQLGTNCILQGFLCSPKEVGWTLALLSSSHPQHQADADVELHSRLQRLHKCLHKRPRQPKWGEHKDPSSKKSSAHCLLPQPHTYPELCESNAQKQHKQQSRTCYLSRPYLIPWRIPLTANTSQCQIRGD